MLSDEWRAVVTALRGANLISETCLPFTNVPPTDCRTLNNDIELSYPPHQFGPFSSDTGWYRKNKFQDHPLYERKFSKSIDNVTLCAPAKQYSSLDLFYDSRNSRLWGWS